MMQFFLQRTLVNLTAPKVQHHHLMWIRCRRQNPLPPAGPSPRLPPWRHNPGRLADVACYGLLAFAQVGALGCRSQVLARILKPVALPADAVQPSTFDEETMPQRFET